MTKKITDIVAGIVTTILGSAIIVIASAAFIACFGLIIMAAKFLWFGVTV